MIFSENPQIDNENITINNMNYNRVDDVFMMWGTRNYVQCLIKAICNKEYKEYHQ